MILSYSQGYVWLKSTKMTTAEKTPTTATSAMLTLAIILIVYSH